MRMLSLALVLFCSAAVAEDQTTALFGFGVVGIAVVCDKPVAIVAQDAKGRTVFYSFTKLDLLPASVLLWLNALLDATPEERIVYMTLDETLKDQGIRVICPKPKVST